MAKGSNSKIKILYLLKIMMERTDSEHGLSLAQISDALLEYGISAERKTLYDDIETLRTFGLDIEQRKANGVYYHVLSREFELPELKLLVDSVQSSKFITHKKSTELIKKLEGLASRFEANQLQRQVFVANRIKTMNESIYYTVDYIHEAINKNAKVSFQYFRWNAEKQKVLRFNGERFVVSPWALTFDDENYYMIGYDSLSGSIKHYRVDKMLKLEITDQKRDGAELFKNFDMGLYSKKTFGMFSGDEQFVVLRCKRKLASVMIDRFGEDVNFSNVTNTHFELRIKVQISPLFLTWLMNFGQDITILSPERVKEEYIKLAKDCISQYE
ncbi:MAG: WYL domain-containing protein [Clostridia bacterium]|nr:WYL domain-containing protein [Clostridia bacterium]